MPSLQTYKNWCIQTKNKLTHSDKKMDPFRQKNWPIQAKNKSTHSEKNKINWPIQTKNISYMWRHVITLIINGTKSAPHSNFNYPAQNKTVTQTIFV